MTWTYLGDGSTALDRLRALIGDVDADDQQLQDGMLNAYIASESDTYAAGALAARVLAAKYARQVSKSVGPFSLSAGERVKHYLELAEMLNSSSAATSVNAGPYAGGISVSDKAVNEANTDAVQPDFRRGMHDNSGSPSLTRR